MNRTIYSLCLILVAGTIGCTTLSAKSQALVRKPSAEITDRALSMARLLERHKKLDEARQIYEGVLEKDPDNVVACHRLGVLEVRRGAHDAALEYFARAQQKQKPSAELLSDIGYTQYLKHDLPAAEQSLRESLRLDPHSKMTQTNLGLVLAEQERNEEALAEFRKSLTEAEALSNLAYIQTKLGRLSEAEKNYHQALELDPKQRPAAEALIQYQAARTKAETLAANLERKTNATENTIELASGEAPAEKQADVKPPVPDLPRSLTSSPRPAEEPAATSRFKWAEPDEFYAPVMATSASSTDTAEVPEDDAIEFMPPETIELDDDAPVGTARVQLD